MNKFFKKGLSIFLTCCFIATSSTVVLASDEEVEVPEYMQPNSILIYDSNLDYNFEQGGETTVVDTGSSNIIAIPGMKAVYDKNGLLRNVYYPVPGESGSYQLKNPITLKNNSGVKEKGSGEYKYNNCTLNFGTSTVTGKGQITYYGQPDNPGASKYIGDHNNTLKMGDCATKIYVDDIPTGVKVTAKNTKNGNTKTFTKNDCGGLPNAILDIFEDGSWSKAGICGLTVNGVKDSVDNGTISHKYK